MNLLRPLILFALFAAPALAAERLAVPESGAYLGAYIDFGEHEDRVTLEAILRFEKMVGKRQAIVASSSWWGEQSFPRQNLEIIARHGAVPLVYWSPWDRPYQEYAGPDRFSLREIVAGKHDAYIDAWADGAKAFGRPMLVSWGLEMNGQWFPWSGTFYRQRPDGTADDAAGPELFKQAYRYVVDRVRARGANNIEWVFHANNMHIPYEPWNRMAAYYPGSDYVDWLGLTAYGQQFLDQRRWYGVREVFEAGYKEIAAVDPTKPIMMAEWGIGEFPQFGSKAAFIAEAMRTFRGYPRLKAAVFWHERWPNPDGTYSNLRVHSSPEALEAYRQAVADEFWLAEPRLVEAAKK